MTSGPHSGAEKRGHSRRRTLLRGRICYGPSHAMSLDCVIRDISDSGAKLRAPAGQAMPERFTLLNIPEGIACESRLVWRRGEDAGVQFVSRHDLRHSTDEAYRALRRVWAALAPS